MLNESLLKQKVSAASGGRLHVIQGDIMDFNGVDVLKHHVDPAVGIRLSTHLCGS